MSQLPASAGDCARRHVKLVRVMSTAESLVKGFFAAIANPERPGTKTVCDGNLQLLEPWKARSPGLPT